MDILLQELKTRLQNYGALRPEAWNQIVALIQIVALKPQKSVMLKQGGLAYISKGLLKEYDVKYRESPSILNFLGTHQFFPIHSSTPRLYIKAALPSTICYLPRDALKNLAVQFGELEMIYNNLYAQYQEQSLLKIWLLEMPAPKRTQEFKSLYSSMLPYIKRKDIANYLNISYNYLLAIW